MSIATIPHNPFKGWEEYPTRPGPLTALAVPNKRLSKQLTKLAPALFSTNLDLRILDVAKDGTLISPTSAYVDAWDAESQLLKCASQKPRMRIVSIHSSQSVLPLEISERLLRKLLTFHDVDPAFLNVLFSFGTRPNASECGSSNMSNSCVADGSRNLSYQIRYVEENDRKANQPYSQRQTGVYHHHSSNGEFDLFIVIHPSEESALELQLIEMLQSKKMAREFCEHPYRLHLLPFALYIDNWRYYLRYIGEQLDRKNDKIMTVDLRTAAAVSLNFEKVQTLRDLADITLSLGGHCKSAIAVLHMLEALPENQISNGWSTTPYSNRLNGYQESLPVLTARISNSIELHAYALDLKNQYTAAKINDHVSHLADQSTRDTTAVKWITYLTLIYLPGSFIATLYGMNFFLFNPNTRRIVIAQNFWIYVATWLPLTFLTLLGYLILRFYHRPK